MLLQQFIRKADSSGQRRTKPECILWTEVGGGDSFKGQRGHIRPAPLQLARSKGGGVAVVSHETVILPGRPGIPGGPLCAPFHRAGIWPPPGGMEGVPPGNFRPSARPFWTVQGRRSSTCDTPVPLGRWVSNVSNVGE